MLRGVDHRCGRRSHQQSRPNNGECDFIATTTHILEAVLSLSLFQIENVTIVRYLASDVSLARTRSENADEFFPRLCVLSFLKNPK